MTEKKYLDDDIIRVYKFGLPHNKDNLLATLFWGDQVKVVEKSGNKWKLEFTRQEWNDASRHYEWITYEAEIPAKARFCSGPVMKVRFVDVGQGDAAIIETPQGKLLLLDGGEGDQLKNYMKRAWAYVLKDAALPLDAIIVTHGDADHFAGLVRLLGATRGYNRPLVSPKRVYHAGLVKNASSVAEKKLFGETQVVDGKLYIVDLVDDLRTAPAERMNKPFRDWKAELEKAATVDPTLQVKRLAYGEADTFDFLSGEGIHMQVLGPIVEEVDGKPALPFLHGDGSSYSASHTINGHSVVLRMTYGNVHFLFGADLNRESETGLLASVRQDGLSLAAEILKVPHHGSADFDPAMLEAVRAVVSVVSSGDESETREYIHPRAGLVGALGKYSRPSVERPLVYVTEMVAFFKRIGLASVQPLDNKNKPDGAAYSRPNIYDKSQFGIVHVRTDGERVLVVCHSGKPGMKESYAFHVNELGNVTFEEDTSQL